MKLLPFIIAHLAIRIFFFWQNGAVFNLDEVSNWQIAENHLSGLGYTLNGEQAAFHSSFCVFLYEGLQLIGISLHTWELVSVIISLIVFTISVFYFQRLLKIYVNERIAFYGTLLYLFYPSVIYYIGSLNLYENIVMPLMVISVHLLIKNKLIPVLILAIICTYLRPSTLFIFILVFLIHRIWLIPLLLIAQTPALIKCYSQFNHPVLSTQFGYELLQGHNELAKGSWYGYWSHDTSRYAKMYHFNGNQYVQSRLRSGEAVRWIKENPDKELKLIIRKIFIYFSPQNFEALPFSGWYNPVNLIVHLGFIISLLYFKRGDSLLYVIPIACLMLSIIFFVAYRVRFYAEPFMIILSMRLLSRH